jgi:formylglycine-generating enzyme required for sulfatase activity
VGGIARSGFPGTYTYTTKPNMADKPVNYVTWYDAIRFANWLHNGQGAGDTETGAYTILGGTATPSNGNLITRNVGATWFLPSENEWYKAAYHQPAAQGGDADNYWVYPTASNNPPTMAQANSVGDIVNPGANVANWYNGRLTTVGSAGPLSESFYGTADQGGNVSEWIETAVHGQRKARGGAFFESYSSMQSYFPVGGVNGFSDGPGGGFRVATVATIPAPAVPEPASLIVWSLLGLTVGSATWWRRRKPA